MNAIFNTNTGELTEEGKQFVLGEAVVAASAIARVAGLEPVVAARRVVEAAQAAGALLAQKKD